MTTKDCGVQKIGGYLETDKAGFIVNPASRDSIQPGWREAVDSVVETYREHFGDKLHSVYLRGSVARGTAIKGISDIDTYAVVSMPNERIDRTWVRRFQQAFAARFPFVQGVEMNISSLDGFEERRGQRIMLKTQSVCLFGTDLSTMISPMKPGPDVIQHLPHLEKEISESLEILKGDKTEEEIKNECGWIMKRILRAAFELVMERSAAYARDLYPCYEGFSKYYPEKEPEMYHVLELAVCPVSDPNEVKNVLEGIGNWVVKEYKNLNI